MILPRNMETVLKEMARSFPIVTITGPRQSGKTTLVKATFPEMNYASLEDPDVREFAHSDPRGFLNQYPDGAILDEIQHVPKLVSYIQTIVDDRGKNGLFFLTGSNQFKYMQSVSQSLAGRTGILKLLPFSYDEVYGKGSVDFDKVTFTGFYPRIFDQEIRPDLFLTGYMQTYLERDVRMLLRVKDLMQFHRFVKLCAGRTGQIMNFSSLANDLGVTHKTVKEWVSILEASFIVYLLKPYYRNYNKRVIKSPKLYYIDIGLAAHLMGIENSRQVQTHPLRGALFETLVVSEFIKARFNQGRRDNLFYFRDRTGNEVDLIFETGRGPVPVEIKSAKTITSHSFKGLNYFKKLKKNTPAFYPIMGDHIHQERSEHSVYGYSNIVSVIEELQD